MKKIPVTLILLLLASYLLTAQETANVTYWEPQQTLVASDFQGDASIVPDPTVHSYSCFGMWMVQDMCEDRRERGRLREKNYVIPGIDRSLSYMAVPTTEALVRQQVIFDLFEISARRIRKAVAEYQQGRTDKQSIWPIVRTIEEEDAVRRQKAVETYMREIYFAEVPGAYEKWRILVDNQLHELEAYATTPDDYRRFATCKPADDAYREIGSVSRRTEFSAQ